MVYTAGSLPMLKHGFSLTALQNRSFDALGLGSAVDAGVEVEVFRCEVDDELDLVVGVEVEGEVEDESIHALLDDTLGAASNDDQLDGEEEEHKRLHDLLVEATQPRRQLLAITQVGFAQ